MDRMPAPDPHDPGPASLELRGIRKAFGVVQALGGVGHVGHGGAVHPLVGGNRARKWALLAGVAGV